MKLRTVRSPQELFDFSVRMAYKEASARKILLPVIKKARKEKVVTFLEDRLSFLEDTRKFIVLASSREDAIRKTTVALRMSALPRQAKLRQVLEGAPSRYTAWIRANALMEKYGIQPRDLSEEWINGLNALIVSSTKRYIPDQEDYPGSLSPKDIRKQSFYEAQRVCKKYKIDCSKFPRWQEALRDAQEPPSDLQQKEYTQAWDLIDKFLVIRPQLVKSLSKLSEEIRAAKNIRYKQPLYGQVDVALHALNLINRLDPILKTKVPYFEFNMRKARLWLPMKFTNFDIEVILKKSKKLRELSTDCLWTIKRSKEIFNKAAEGSTKSETLLEALRYISKYLYITSGAINNVIEELEILLHIPFNAQVPYKPKPIFSRSLS